MDLNSVNITATQVAKNYFSAYVENGFIYSYSVYGERQQVGVTNDAYTALQKTAQEALDKAEKYYQRLVELGDIVPPKTSEETIAELMSVVSELRNEIREMKTVQHKGDSNESVKYTEALGIKISPQIEEAIAKAQQLANNYGNSKEGFIKAVNENGGTESLTKALATLDNPNVARVLTALGHPPESIKQAVNSLGAIAPTPQQTPNNQNISNEIRSFEERLKRLK